MRALVGGAHEKRHSSCMRLGSAYPPYHVKCIFLDLSRARCLLYIRHSASHTLLSHQYIIYTFSTFLTFDYQFFGAIIYLCLTMSALPFTPSKQVRVKHLVEYHVPQHVNTNAFIGGLCN